MEVVMDDFRLEQIRRVVVYHATGATPYPSLAEALADVHQVDRDRLAEELEFVLLRLKDGSDGPATRGGDAAQ
jgi:hypothetical protein